MIAIRFAALRKCSNVAFRKLILDETEITVNHITPEIKLRLITKNCRLFSAKIDESFPFKNDPFWGFYWPGGQAVTRYILDNPEIVKHKKVLDFGSGCGATSIACMMAGAQQVIANDIDEVSAVASEINAELNGTKIKTETRDLIDCPSTFKFDLILLGDVFYDEEFASKLLPWIKNLLAENRKILIGDPGRHALSTELKLKLLARYQLPEHVCIENNGFSHTNIWQIIR